MISLVAKCFARSNPHLWSRSKSDEGALGRAGAERSVASHNGWRCSWSQHGAEDSTGSRVACHDDASTARLADAVTDGTSRSLLDRHGGSENRERGNLGEAHGSFVTACVY